MLHDTVEELPFLYPLQGRPTDWRAVGLHVAFYTQNTGILSSSLVTSHVTLNPSVTEGLKAGMNQKTAFLVARWPQWPDSAQEQTFFPSVIFYAEKQQFLKNGLSRG